MKPGPQDDTWFSVGRDEISQPNILRKLWGGGK